MLNDPIVEEVRKNGQNFAARFNDDLAAICTALKDRERTSGRLVVNRAPCRRPINVIDEDPIASAQM